MSQRNDRPDLEVGLEPIGSASREHRRGLVEGLAAAAVVLIVAAGAGLVGFSGLGIARPSPSLSSAGSSTATNSMSPLPTPTPVATPRATAQPLPEIGVGTDPVLASLAKETTVVSAAVGDRLIVWKNVDKAPSQWPPFAYDPQAGQRWTLEIPSGMTWFDPQSSSGALVLSWLGKPAAPGTTRGLDGVAIEDVGTGSVRTFWPTGGYDALYVELADTRYAFGWMVKDLPRAPDGPAIAASRAVVIDLASGNLIDLTPPDAGNPPQASVLAVANGRALVLVTAGPTGDYAPRSVSLVDVATAKPVPVDLGSASLGSLLEARLTGDLIVGRSDTATEVGGPFVYDISTGMLERPVGDPTAAGDCPYQLDATRLVCYEDTVGGRQIFVYDASRHERTVVPAAGGFNPGLFGMHLLGVGNGDIVVGEEQGSSALVYVAASGLVYRLELGGGAAPPSIAILGNLVICPNDSYGVVVDSRVWRLP